jgi:hypothetical protein
MFFCLDCTTGVCFISKTVVVVVVGGQTGWFLVIKYKNMFPNFSQLRPSTTCITFDVPIHEECDYPSSDMHITQTQIIKKLNLKVWLTLG